MEMYKTTDEAVTALFELVRPFLNRLAMFHVGMEIVDEFRDYTPFEVDDWGVYEDQEERTLSVYNSDAELVMMLHGNEEGSIYEIKFETEVIERMVSGD